MVINVVLNETQRGIGLVTYKQAHRTYQDYMPHRLCFHIYSHTRPPKALASDVTLSLTGLQDGHNTIYILEGHVAPFQSVEYLREPVHQALSLAWPYAIVFHVGVSQSLHELGLLNQI